MKLGTNLCHVGQGHVFGGTGRLDLGLAAVEESGKVGQVLRSAARCRTLAAESS